VLFNSCFILVLCITVLVFGFSLSHPVILFPLFPYALSGLDHMPLHDLSSVSSASETSWWNFLFGTRYFDPLNIRYGCLVCWFSQIGSAKNLSRCFLSLSVLFRWMRSYAYAPYWLGRSDVCGVDASWFCGVLCRRFLSCCVCGVVHGRQSLGLNVAFCAGRGGVTTRAFMPIFWQYTNDSHLRQWLLFCVWRASLLPIPVEVLSLWRQ